MTVYVDGLFYKGSGIGRYYEFLLSGLTERGIEVITAVPEHLKEQFVTEYGNNTLIEPIFVPFEKFDIKGFVSQSNLLKPLQEKVSWFIYPHVNLPLRVPGNVIVTIHDLIPLTSYWDGSKFNAWFFRMLVNRAVGKARKIVCVSQTTRGQLIEMFPMATHKSAVIYESYESRLLKLAGALADPPVFGSYFLYVGNRKRHKNLVSVIKAFAKIAPNSDIKFVIAGPKDEEGPDEIEKLVDQFDLRNRVQFFVSPSDETLASLYKNARFLVQPSLIEGFGLPPLEALSFGIPVLLSDIPIFREIYEDAATYFDPLSVDDIAEKLREWASAKTRPQVDGVKINRIMAKFDREKILDQYIELLVHRA
jgi:glycosyltransferase involved in cell wall biosynthesis